MEVPIAPLPGSILSQLLPKDPRGRMIEHELTSLRSADKGSLSASVGSTALSLSRYFHPTGFPPEYIFDVLCQIALDLGLPLEEAEEAITLGLEEGLKRQNPPPKPTAAADPPPVADGPEIISGALQNHGRAPLIGTTTFGKDTIQLVFELQDKSSLHVTSAKWWLPGLQPPVGEGGLQPDIVVSSSNSENYDPYLEAAIHFFFGN